MSDPPAAESEPGAPDADEPDLVRDTDGLWVLSRSALLRRGTCCGLACRNCPYVGTPLEHPHRARALRRKRRRERRA